MSVYFNGGAVSIICKYFLYLLSCCHEIILCVMLEIKTVCLGVRCVKFTRVFIRARRARYILVCECGRAWAESGLGGPLYMEYGSNEGPITH